MLLPKIKKKIKSFLQDEEGKISKHAIMTVGAIVGTAAVIGIAAKSVEAVFNHPKGKYSPLLLNVDTNTHTIEVNHAHHGNHGNHSSY